MLLYDDVLRLSSDVGKKYRVRVNKRDIIIDNSYMGKRYGYITKEAKEAVNIFAKKEGIMLDYVYSGKAAAGLIDYIDKKNFGKGSNVLFIHTGGNVHLFK